MTTQEIITYYANLLILQYLGKPRAYATVQTSVTPIIMDQLPSLVNNAFNLNTAVGVQLDVLGKYQGVSRNGYGVNGLPITLNDTDFRTLIRLAITVHNAGSSLATIQEFLFNYFQGTILVVDNKNMQMNYTVYSVAASENLVQLVQTLGLLPKPMGVQLASVTYITTSGNLFGMRTYSLPNLTASPFNTYSNYHTDYPWLTY